MMTTKITLGLVFLLAVYSSLAAQYVDFANGSRTVWLADFSKWPNVSYKYGYVGPQYGDYVLEAYSSTWVGTNRLLPITSLPRDFIVDVSFKVVHKPDCTLRVTLEDAGREHSELWFYFGIWESGGGTFAIYEEWVKNNNVYNKRTVADRTIPAQLVSHVRWHKINRLSFKREGSQVGFYFNGRLLKSFRTSHFVLKRLGIGLAGESKVLVTAIEARIPAH